MFGLINIHRKSTMNIESAKFLGKYLSYFYDLIKRKVVKRALCAKRGGVS